MLGERTIHNLALIGFQGSGKTSVGHLIAAQTHLGYLDTNHWIELRAGKSLTQVFAEDGDAVFRELERQAVQELVRFRKMVIATGDRLGADPEHLASLKTHSLVVCLWASPNTIWERVRQQPHRPLLREPNPRETIRRWLAEWAPVYRQADVLVSTELRSVRDVAQQVIHQFHLARVRAHPLPPKSG